MSRRLALFALSTLTIGGGVVFRLHRSPGSPPAPAGQPSAYVRPSVCHACHAAQAEAYRQTGMARSFSPFHADSSPADFRRRNRFLHAASGRHYSMTVREGRAYMRRHQTGPGGVQANVVEKRIDYALGSGHKAIAFLHRTPLGELIQLPVAWYTEKGGYWAMNPSYDRPEHEDFRRRIRYDCFFCHNGYPPSLQAASFYDDPIYPEALPAGIDCQRCHGPGGAHVGAASRRAPQAEIRSSIVNPKRLERARQLEVCLQCHLQSTSRTLPYTVVRVDRPVFSYRPADPLPDYALHFDHPAGSGFEEKFEIAHAAYRLLQSRCFQQSGRLTCTTCHDPHRLARGEPARERFKQVCRECHATSHNPAGDCISCHMPQRRTEDVVHVVMTDHKIQRRPPPGDLLAPRPEIPENPATAHRGEVALFYPAGADRDGDTELHVAIAQVRAGVNLAVGLPRFEALVSRHRPARAEIYYELAGAYGRAGRRLEAFAAHEEALKRNPNFLPSLRAYGMELSEAGQFERGAELLRRALAMVPKDARTLHDLGVNLYRQGRMAEAVSALRQALASDPDAPETHNALAAALLDSGDLSGAEQALLEAIRAKPDYALAQQNLAALRSARGRSAAR